MAFVGLAKPYIAKLTETNGVASYADGFVFGKAISLDIEKEANEASLFGDNQQIEYESEFRRANITLGTNTIPIKAHSTMFGHTVNTDTETGVTEIVEKIDDQQNYVGFGAYAEEKVDGQKKYVAIWIHKVKFTESTENYRTKGDSIEYQTPSVTGIAIGTDTKNWRTKKIFSTEEEADAYLKKMAGITEA